MTIKTFMAAAVFAASGALAADALTVQWSVDIDNSGVDAPDAPASGTLTGFLDADEVSPDLYEISSIYDITYGGVAASDLGFVFSLFGTFTGGGGLMGVGTVNTATDTIDVLACSTAACDGDASGIGLIYSEGEPQFFFASPEYGATDASSFSNASYTILPAVPLPAGGLLLLSGVAGFAGLKRRKARAA